VGFRAQLHGVIRSSRHSLGEREDNADENERIHAVKSRKILVRRPVIELACLEKVGASLGEISHPIRDFAEHVMSAKQEAAIVGGLSKPPCPLSKLVRAIERSLRNVRLSQMPERTESLCSRAGMGGEFAHAFKCAHLLGRAP
jgi:hypothetical protein